MLSFLAKKHANKSIVCHLSRVFYTLTKFNMIFLHCVSSTSKIHIDSYRDHFYQDIFQVVEPTNSSLSRKSTLSTFNFFSLIDLTSFFLRTRKSLMQWRFRSFFDGNRTASNMFYKKQWLFTLKSRTICN